MDLERRLSDWFAARYPQADRLCIEGLDRIPVGHSAETLALTLVHDDERDELVIRVRPTPPGLLEPYDLRRQFDILRALEATPVRAPRAMWFEPSGDVLGGEFYVMERLPGTVIERGVPAELRHDPGRVRRMCESMVDQIAAIHRVDTSTAGLGGTGDGAGYVERELGHWSGEMQRVKRGPLPALERLSAELVARRPAPNPTVTLVHGDPKPGNFAFVADTVSAVFDWELATLGDPMADVGWAEVNWSMTGNITAAPGAPSADELVARWEELTGMAARERPWYRAFQLLKLAVILLVGAHLFDAGFSDDVRYVQMARMVHRFTTAGLAELGIDEVPPPGPVLPRDERIRQVEEAH